MTPGVKERLSVDPRRKVRISGGRKKRDTGGDISFGRSLLEGLHLRRLRNLEKIVLLGQRKNPEHTNPV